MDQDYERRLLRQINIQNENTMPCVSTDGLRLTVMLLSVSLVTFFLELLKELGPLQSKPQSFVGL